MPRAFRSSFRWFVGALALFLAVGVSAPRAMAQDGGGETPPQVDPNSPVQRVKDSAANTVQFIKDATDAAESRLFSLVGKPSRTIRQEAERSIRGINELAKRGNRQLDGLSRQFLADLKRAKASKAKVDELKAAVTAARSAIKTAQNTALADIRAQRDRTLAGDISNPNPPQAGPN
jgi:hypothetical protein